MDQIPKLLQPFPLTVEINVQWGDMDAARHVNNTVYLRWAETARIAYFRELRLFVRDGSKQGIILGWQDCKYIFPVTYPDTIVVGIKTTAIEQDRFMLQCHYYSQRYQRLVAISNQRMVAYDYEALAKIDVPEDWKKKLLNQ